MLEIERQPAIEVRASEWVRVPGAIKACGLGKTRLYELLNEARGKIRTISLKSPGAQRGARLINLPSLLDYLNQLSQKQGGESNGTA